MRSNNNLQYYTVTAQVMESGGGAIKVRAGQRGQGITGVRYKTCFDRNTNLYLVTQNICNNTFRVQTPKYKSLPVILSPDSQAPC